MNATLTTIALAAVLVAAGPDGPKDTMKTPGGRITDVELASLKLDFDALESLGSQQFGVRMHAKGKTGGSLEFQSRITLTTSVMGGRVVFDDQWEIMGRTYGYHAWCRTDAALSMETCDMSVQRGDNVTNAAFVVRDGTATVETGDRKVEMPYPAGTVSQAALFRIIPQLPRTANQAYTFAGYSEAIEIRARQPQDGGTFRILCRGQEPVTLEQSPVPCTRYTVQADREVDFYVDENGSLRMIVADNGDTVMLRLPDPSHANVELDAP